MISMIFNLIIICIFVLGIFSFIISLNSFSSWFRAGTNGKLILNILIGFVFLLCVYICFEMKHKDISDLGYEIEYLEEQCDVEVKKVIKEKGNEPEYVVSIFYGETTIPQSIYDEYIGQENNAVTIKKASASIYIGHTLPFGIPTDFSGEQIGLRVILKDRWSWPWENDIKPFTIEEINELAASYLEGDIKPNGTCFIDKSKELKKLIKT